MKEMNGKWLSQKLAQNGFTLADLAEQTELPLETIENIVKSNEGDEDTWNLILDTMNEYPRVIVPSDQVLADLQNDINQFGGDALCEVFYGVNQNLLAFCEYKCLADLYAHGSNVPTEYLSVLQMTLNEALELFTKQNFANQKFE